jgi:hypothetical protein
MACIKPMIEKTCGRAVLSAAGAGDLADGTLNKINIHKPNGNTLKINRHISTSLLSDKRGTDAVFVPALSASSL